ncbi:amino acid ABC transporter ATP-binding protein [Ancylobacter sonchi]|uniref:amino acid ABC transporter ATP-binding protein n=1 Tax=Ancylobacter sonchi TaxID=1937790 RepID=UPI0024847BF0|nr:amino acid ABC transporter ATP-binding protein [Ancylobacter sonchi]
MPTAPDALRFTPPLDALKLTGIRKTFGGTTILSGFSLDVPEGQRLALIGGSGSGKTTVLRLIAGLERPDAGEIELFGRQLPYRRFAGRLIPDDPPEARELRRPVGMVFQHFNLFQHLTALENVIEAPIHVLGQSPAEARRAAMALLDSVGLADLADRYPRQLSGGQQQRVAIVRALALKPRVLLFDEVTASLDPEKVAEVLAVMRALAADERVTMIIVTHEMGFAREVADRVVFMQRGVIVEDTPAAAFFAAPQDPRSRAFLNLAS